MKRTTTTSRLAALAAAAPALVAAAPAAAAEGTGGAYASATPRVQQVACASGCADLSSARQGSLVRISGRHLRQVAAVSFLGARGRRDDVLARPDRARGGSVDVRVPPGARTGPLQVVNADGRASAETAPLAIDPGPTRKAAAGSVPAIDARVRVRRVFFGGHRPVALDYMLAGDAPAAVSIAVIRVTDGTAVATWDREAVEPGAVQRVRWKGVDASTGRAAAAGRYEFRVWTAAGDTARASRAAGAPTAAQSFLLLDHRFPIRGRHSYGEGGARFGAGRAGHVHEGQDVMAACGTPLVAARGGVVKFAGYQGNAGNYVVIDEAGSGVDDIYMHLREPALVQKGDRVFTGQRIGDVGDTGDASACHLHFEEWSAPGWYTGGRPFDPLADLRAWDRYS